MGKDILTSLNTINVAALLTENRKRDAYSHSQQVCVRIISKATKLWHAGTTFWSFPKGNLHIQIKNVYLQ